MPNWCINQLRVYGGNTAEVVKLLRKGEGMDFNSIIPYPQDMIEADIADGNTDDRYMSQRQYCWRVDNWGTKWEPNEANFLEASNGDLWADFCTAWSPPIPVVRRLSELFPSLTFNIVYEEEGMDFSGEETYKSGVCIEDAHGAYGDICADKRSVE